MDQQIMDIISKLPHSVQIILTLIGTLCVLATGYIQSTKTSGLPVIGGLATLIDKVESIPVLGSILTFLERFSVVQRKPEPTQQPPSTP